jgi:hypothetical protein
MNDFYDVLCAFGMTCLFILGFVILATIFGLMINNLTT